MYVIIHIHSEYVYVCIYIVFQGVLNILPKDSADSACQLIFSSSWCWWRWQGLGFFFMAHGPLPADTEWDVTNLFAMPPKRNQLGRCYPLGPCRDPIIPEKTNLKDPEFYPGETHEPPLGHGFKFANCDSHWISLPFRVVIPFNSPFLVGWTSWIPWKTHHSK